jgi:hypothetical protein
MTSLQPIIPDDTPLNLADPQRWAFRYSNTFIAPTEDGKIISPIPEQSLSVSLTSPVLAVQALAQNDQWANYLGSLSQRQEIGINATARLSRFAVLRGTSLVRFNQDVTGAYTLTFLPNSKIERVLISIFEYLP